MTEVDQRWTLATPPVAGTMQHQSSTVIVAADPLGWQAAAACVTTLAARASRLIGRIAILCAAAGLATGAQAESDDLGVKLERVAAVSTHAEGPALAPDGTVVFCDLTVTAQSNMEAGAIYAFDPRSGRTRVLLAPSGMASGIKFEPDGDMVLATGADHGSRALVRIDGKTRRARFIATRYQDRPFNAPNDLTIDSAGRIYFTDSRYFGDEPVEQAVSGVYRLDPDGSVHLLTGGMSKPNGIALSPDQKTLYVSNNDNGIFDRGRQGAADVRNGPMQIVAFDLNPAGMLSKRRVLVDLQSGGGPDGILVDEQGNIWAAIADKANPLVRIYDPMGHQLGTITVPEMPYNVLLTSSATGRTLYVTAGRGLYRAKLPANLMLGLAAGKGILPIAQPQ